LNVAAFGVVQPHGYADSSSECASTDSVTRRRSPLNVRPTNAARIPSGITSVRRIRSPSAPARSICTYPCPLVNRDARSHRPSTANHSPSSSLIGGLQKPPISPRMCQPVAG
jgi:hypothetical protein